MFYSTAVPEFEPLPGAPPQRSIPPWVPIRAGPRIVPSTGLIRRLGGQVFLGTQRDDVECAHDECAAHSDCA